MSGAYITHSLAQAELCSKAGDNVSLFRSAKKKRID